MDYPPQGNPYNTLPPSKRRDLWGVGTVYVHTYADLHALFHYLGIQGDVFFSVCTRNRFCKRNVRSEVRTRDLDDDKKCEGVP